MGTTPYDHYSMVIQWSDEDRAYIVTVPELPGCRTHGASYEEAVAMGRDAIESWITARQASGRPIPPPRLFATTLPRQQAG
jgi:predicted RNase H-like HicB family nuclease